jgi:ADP-ribosylglycohydrolase
MNRADKIRGGLWGVLVADALGVPHQFKSAEIIRTANIQMVMPPGYSKTYPKVPYGTWSDDGSLTLALADSLTGVGHYDPTDFGNALVRWYTKGHYTPNKKAYDIGATTSEAILRMMRGHVPEQAGLTQETSNGNGSLMRTHGHEADGFLEEWTNPLDPLLA